MSLDSSLLPILADQSAEWDGVKGWKWLRADQACCPGRNLVSVRGQLGHPWIKMTTDQAEKSQGGVTGEK